MISGIINVYKEAGYTSHDVVARLRGILRQKKIGHTGTLDPAAEGVLPVCLGKGTRLCSILEETDKTYQVTVLLGTETDTEDLTGEVLRQRPVTCTEEEVRSCISSFIGEIDQIPPMYSALKVNGKKLYELAREGKTIERKPRRITVHNIEIIDISLPEVTASVTCSKGTYIRSLCRDIGEQLSCGGCMKNLLRTHACGFSIQEAKKLDEIEAMMKGDGLGDFLTPIDQMFAHYPQVIIPASKNKLLMNGNAIPYHKIEGEKIRVYDEEKHFIGLYTYEKGLLKPFKLFFDMD